MSKKYLSDVYGIGDQDAVRGLYDDWAATYDAEIAENGYATPARCAAAMAGCGLAADTPILDLGCGTGLSGLAMRAEGFTVIDGTDLSPGMLEIAAGRGLYRHLFASRPDTGPDVAPGSYAAVAAVGVIGTGAAPPQVLDTAVDILGPGGVLCFSYNDHTLAEPEYTDRLKAHLDAGALKPLFEEHGAHLPRLGLASTVYVFEKT